MMDITWVKYIIEVTIVPGIMNFNSQFEEILRSFNSVVSNVQKNKTANFASHHELEIFQLVFEKIF